MSIVCIGQEGLGTRHDYLLVGCDTKAVRQRGTMGAVVGVLAVWLSVRNTLGNGLVELSSVVVYCMIKA